eukprot:6662361-Prymnesium_polylepis.1
MRAAQWHAGSRTGERRAHQPRPPHSSALQTLAGITCSFRSKGIMSPRDRRDRVGCFHGHRCGCGCVIVCDSAFGCCCVITAGWRATDSARCTTDARDAAAAT